MTTYTTNSALPKPAATDAPNGPSQVGALADTLDTMVIRNFATTTLRDSTITAPTAGQTVSVAGALYTYTGSAWALSSRPTIQYDAAYTGATLTTGTQGLASVFTVASQSWAQTVSVNFAALITTGGSTSETVDIIVRVNGTATYQVRGLAATGASIVGATSLSLAASTSCTLQLVATKITGSTSATFTSNAVYAWFKATASPA